MYGRKKRIYRKRTVRPVRTFKKSSRRTSKSRYRRYRRSSLSTIRPKWTNPISQTGLFKLKYEDTGFQAVLDTLGGHLEQQVFRLNSVYDPDATGVGVQPYGYEELTPTLYSRYQVYGSKIKVFVTPQPTAALTSFLQPVRAWLIPWRTSSLIAETLDPSDWLQLPFRKVSNMNAQEGSKGFRISNYCSMNKLFPEMKGANQNQFQSAYNTNPNIQAYWILIFDNINIPIDVTVTFDVRITYYVRLIRENTTDESG